MRHAGMRARPITGPVSLQPGQNRKSSSTRDNPMKKVTISIITALVLAITAQASDRVYDPLDLTPTAKSEAAKIPGAIIVFRMDGKNASLSKENGKGEHSVSLDDLRRF